MRMTLTVVRDILLDSDIVLLIQDIPRRNGLFTTEICANVVFSFPFFMMSVIFFSGYLRTVPCTVRAFSCIVGKPRCSAKHPLFQCRSPSVFNINHEDCSPHHAGVLPIHMNAAAKDSYMCMS